jgi:hypothetical protein
MRISRSFVVGSLLLGLSAGSVVVPSGCEDDTKKSGTLVAPTEESKKTEDAMRNFMQQKAQQSKAKKK